VSDRNPARDRVAVVGYAQSRIERHAAQPVGAVTVETARAAVADAGLQVADVDGFVGSALLPTAGAHAAIDGESIVTPGWLAQRLGVNPRFASGFQGFGQIPGTVALAANAIASGAADYVLMHRALHNPAGAYHGNPMREAAGPLQWTVPQGFFGPPAMIALPANEYAQRHGATRESLAAIVVEARKNGARIPWSYWCERPLTVDDYLATPLLTDPICKLDCDIPVDGVATFVLTSAERARDLPHRPVLVSGYALGHPTRRRPTTHWTLDDVMEVGAETARRLREQSGVGTADVDLPQLYDGFSPLVWFWLEVLGFCGPGEAHELVASGGIDADAAGGLPVLSGGGALGNGRMHGVPQMLECYLQLSGRAGERQRTATVGLACHASPHFGGAVVYRAGD
jgi:acetyl-CoA acetyltransferase